MRILDQKIKSSEVTAALVIEAEEFLLALERVYQSAREHYPVPGFADGHAPRQALESCYGAEVLRQEAAELCIDAYWNAYLQSIDRVPLTPPELLGTEWPQEGGVILRLRAVLRSQVKLGEYKGLSVPHQETEEAWREAVLAQAVRGMQAEIPSVLVEQALDRLENQEMVRLCGDPVYVLLTDLFKVLETAYHAAGVTRGRLQIRSAAADIMMQAAVEGKEPRPERLHSLITDSVRRYRDIPAGFEARVPEFFQARNARKVEMTPQERGEEVFETYLSAQDMSRSSWRKSQRDRALTLIRQELLLDAVIEAEHLNADPEDLELVYRALAEQSGVPLEQVTAVVAVEAIDWQARREKAVRLIIDAAVPQESVSSKP